MEASSTEMLAIRGMIIASGLKAGFEGAGFNPWTMKCANTFYAANATAD